MENYSKIKASLKAKWEVMLPFLGERGRRIWSGLEAQNIGWGGIGLVSEVTGLSRKTISKGMQEIKSVAKLEERTAERKKGAGRKAKTVTEPRLIEELEALVQPHTKWYKVP